MDGPTKYDEQIPPVIQGYCSANYPMLLPQLLPPRLEKFIGMNKTQINVLKRGFKIGFHFHQDAWPNGTDKDMVIVEVEL